ncbi:MAG: TetR/AcrR family transcriptional regulator, partial [Aeromicrobium sp.]
DAVTVKEPRIAGVGAAVSHEQQARRETGPLTSKGQARKAALLDAARRVFERQGFVETRVADIAAEAKVAQGTFYTYFDSKETVFRAVATRVGGDLIINLRSNRPLSEPTYDATHAAMKRFVDAYRPHARIIALIEQVGTFTPEMKELRLHVRQAFVDRAARSIAHLQEEGVAGPGIDPALTAEVLGAMVEQTCFLWMGLGRDFDEKPLLHALTSVWLRGIGVPVPADRPLSPAS